MVLSPRTATWSPSISKETATFVPSAFATSESSASVSTERYNGDNFIGVACRTAAIASTAAVLASVRSSKELTYRSSSGSILHVDPATLVDVCHARRPWQGRLHRRGPPRSRRNWPPPVSVPERSFPKLKRNGSAPRTLAPTSRLPSRAGNVISQRRPRGPPVRVAFVGWPARTGVTHPATRIRGRGTRGRPAFRAPRESWRTTP